MQNSPLVLDGKPVRRFLFARYTFVAQNGAIPCDRVKRKELLNATDQQKYLVQVQVDAFDIDHALDRLEKELYAFVPRKDWEFVCELDDPSHDLGMMGAKHPLLPVGTRNIH